MQLETNRITHHLNSIRRHTPPEKKLPVDQTVKKDSWMKTALLVTALGLATGLGFVAGTYFPARQNWEYTFAKMEGPRDLQAAYEMGEEGWLVAGTFQDWHGTQMLFLQRPYRVLQIFDPAVE